MYVQKMNCIWIIDFIAYILRLVKHLFLIYLLCLAVSPNAASGPGALLSQTVCVHILVFPTSKYKNISGS